jgi:hypothetical protein
MVERTLRNTREVKISFTNGRKKTFAPMSFARQPRVVAGSRRFRDDCFCHDSDYPQTGRLVNGEDIYLER